MKYLLCITSILVLLPISSCHRGTENREGIQAEEGAGSGHTGEIVLTRAQFEAADMQVGDPKVMEFSQEVSATGYIVSSLNGKAEISTMISGRVRQINHSEGENVKRGTVLFTLESQEIIMIQQEYAAAFQKLRLLKSDHDRLRSLSEENIVATKDFIKAESEYQSILAQVEGLRVRLRLIHIEPSKIENGIISPNIHVISPIQGIIARQELVPGQYIESSETTMVIVDTEKLRLKLQVFERFIGELIKGQTVQFTTPDQPDMIHQAMLTHIGNTIDPETRTVQCYAEINPLLDRDFAENMYVEAKIRTYEREALAIPEQALIREEDRDYIFALQDENEDLLTFRKFPVSTGITRKGYTEILDENIENVLVRGVYNLVAE